MTTLKQQVQKPVKKSSVRPQRRIPWIFLLALLFAIFMTVRAWELLEKKATARKMNDAYHAELEALSAKEHAMRTELEALQTPEGVEREIREKFRVTKEGEELVVVVPAETALDTDTETDRGLFYFLRNIFKKDK